MTNVRAHGTVCIKKDGAKLQILKSEDITYNLGIPKAEGVESGRGYTLKDQNSYVSFETELTGDIDTAALLTNKDDINILLILENGKEITFKNCFVVSDGEVSVNEGKLKLKYESSDPAQEVRKY